MNKVIIFLLMIINIASAKADMSGYTLVGKAKMTWFTLSIYDAELWSKNQKSLYQDSLILKLRYKRSLSGSSIANRSIDELIANGVEKSIAVSQLDSYLAIFPDVKDGDSISAHFEPSAGIVFFLNEQKMLGKIENVNNAKIFLDIWLSEKTTEPEMRDSLLGVKK